ncbi:UDP-N-acetylmuramoyl-tripeptide--D-alanyl-D-alanine ligase [Paenibacillus sp. J23TS9]|uniref:UDP-N-acetylmuramoyl-tripeptide--D-alanyl-D- alanine ligase n=1 Tax=Paenibacillus sp. J23TS9 TaxID=2807193 RepID=UPI001B0032B3|nr:UDP-N-acetylmuramoyl-tripeptide--D-alanyl-D-alanine ligase [Paenibacillus sp. J23TS9]GIP25174.1 UDP-N-acetylmuramoyl-tripeptide--D-alanyl-D-alanine ligase [Paenibacillus sp. J23TS9]
MITKKLGDVAVMCGGVLTQDHDCDIQMEGVFTDSRKLVSGRLFVPLVGENFDGHAFAAAALEGGACGVLWQRDRGFPPEGPVIVVEDTLAALQALAKAYLADVGCRVVGITGSNGKTTTKDMVYALLETSFKVHKTGGNFNNHIGLPLTILEMPADTEIVVLEMGMSGRHEIESLSAIASPEVAVITNIGEAHLLQLGSRHEIARAKLEIVSGMKPGGLLIYHGDEPLIPLVLSEPETVKPEGLTTFTFGMDQDKNDDYPTGMMFHSKGIIFTSHLHPEEGLELPLLGQHNVINCLAALAVASYFGISGDKIREGISGLQLTGMRIEQITAPSGLTLLNDAYNASPLSMKAAIDALDSLKGYHRKVAVLGDMLELGPKQLEFHAEVGEYAVDGKVDMLYTYGPLSEEAAKAAQLKCPDVPVYHFTDKKELASHLTGQLHPKDIVLIKASRGMKMEEIVDALVKEDLHN